MDFLTYLLWILNFSLPAWGGVDFYIFYYRTLTVFNSLETE